MRVSCSLTAADREASGDGVAHAMTSYEARVAPDGRVQELLQRSPGGDLRAIVPESAEGVGVLAGGRDILYHFEDDGRRRNVPYPELLEAMHREIQLAIHKARHAELLDEPELIPSLQRLLADLGARAAAFRRACGDPSSPR